MGMLIVFGGASALFLTSKNVEAATTYTMAQVQAHNTSADCWAAVNNKVYNLTTYVTAHPGGAAAINAICGKDATAVFSAQHSGSTSANAMLVTNYIGDIAAVVVVPDITAPTIPTNLTSPTKTKNSIQLTWTASSDNKAVTGYKIYKDGILLGSTSGLQFNSTGLTASTSYQFTISAYDTAGNTSAKTATLTVMTLAKNTTGTTTPNISKCHHDDDHEDRKEKKERKEKKDKKDKHAEYRNNFNAHTKNLIRKAEKIEREDD